MIYVGLGRAYELIDAWPMAQETYEAMIATAQAMGAVAMECLLFHAPLCAVLSQPQQTPVGRD